MRALRRQAAGSARLGEVSIMAKSFKFLWFLIAIVRCSAIPAFAHAVRVPGTNVILTPPAGFSVASQYPGFEREADQASVMVTELPGAAADMLRAMTTQALA